MPSLSAQAQLDQLVSTCGEPPMSSTRIVGESYSRARCGRGIQHGRWQRFGFEIGSRTEVVSHEERKFWFARIEAMGRLDHAGGVVFLHLSRGRGVTAPTPVAQRVEVVGLRGGKDQGKGRGDLHLATKGRTYRRLPRTPTEKEFRQKVLIKSILVKSNLLARGQIIERFVLSCSCRLNESTLRGQPQR